MAYPSKAGEGGVAILAANREDSLSSSLSVKELLENLSSSLEEGADRGYTILFHQPEGGGFSVFASHGTECGRIIDPEAAGALRLFYRSAEKDDLLRDAPPLWKGSPPIIAAFPLVFRGRKYGLFLLHGASGTDLPVWRRRVAVLSAELVKTQMLDAADNECAAIRMKLDALNEAGKLVGFVDLDTLLPRLMELSLRIMNAQVGAIVLAEENGFHGGVEWGLTEEILANLRTQGGGSFIAAAMAKGEPILIPHAASSDQVDTSGSDVCVTSLLTVPLTFQDKTLGLIVIANGNAGGLDRSQSEVLSTIANISAAAVDNAILYKNSLKHERISAEIQLASTIQKSLLPETPPVMEGVDIDGWSMACTETGGDYYDYFPMDDGKIGIVIGDATGHGMGAALMMFIVRSTLYALLMQSSDLTHVVSTMNDRVERDTQDDRFMTFFFGILDRKSGRISYTSAGHDPPALFRPGTGDFIELKSTGIPLGIMAGSVFTEESAELRPGDCLVFGTDGIWEARNPAGERYGCRRLRDLIARHHREDAREISAVVRDDILRFRGAGSQLDDITAVFVKVV